MVSTTPLLTADQVGKYLILRDMDPASAGGSVRALMDAVDGLAVGYVDDRALRYLYTNGFSIATTGRQPEVIPDDLIQELLVAHPDISEGRALREHFLALGVLEGIKADNPILAEYAPLAVAYSTEPDYTGVRRIIETGPPAVTT